MYLKQPQTSCDKLPIIVLFIYCLLDHFTFHHLVATFFVCFLPLMMIQMRCMDPVHQNGVKYTSWCQIALSNLGPFIFHL